MRRKVELQTNRSFASRDNSQVGGNGQRHKSTYNTVGDKLRASRESEDSKKIRENVWKKKKKCTTGLLYNVS